ncbi:MAG: outer rane efflux protein [Myxococcaceae bacterium]|nr:outer rane efflux protein [Myxococcaceae bacterium]
MRRALLIGVLAASTAASAQNATLEQVLASAEKNNVDWRVSAEQRARAAAEFRQAWTALLPALTATGAATHNEVPTVLPPQFNSVVITPSDQLDGVARIDLPLIDTTRWFRAAASSAAEGGAVERELLTRDQVRRQVVSGWYAFVGSLAVRNSAKKSLTAAEEQAKLQEIRLSAGAATEIERLRAIAEQARNQQVVADSENLVALARRNLRTLTFIEPGDEAPLPEVDTRPAPPLEELEARIELLPAVRAADQDVLASERLLTASRLALLPVIGAQFTERVSNATGFAGRTATYNTGVYLNWRLDVPTFSGMNVQESGLSIARLQAERARLTSRDQIHTDWQRQRAALTKVEAAQAQVEAANRAAAAARDRYAVGASTQLDVILAERDVLNAEVGQIQARTDLSSARVGLRISAGLPLFGP